MTNKLGIISPKLKDIINSTRSNSEWNLIKSFHKPNNNSNESKLLGDRWRKFWSDNIQGFQQLDTTGTDPLILHWAKNLAHYGCFDYSVHLKDNLIYDPFYSVSQGGWIPAPEGLIPYICLIGEGEQLPDKKIEMIGRYFALRDKYSEKSATFGKVFYLLPDGMIKTEKIVFADDSIKCMFWERIRRYKNLKN